MDLNHSFTVPASVADTWATFEDIESVAGCFPGAIVTEVDGNDFKGTCKVKLGPIAMVYSGTGTFLEKDEAAHRFVIEAKGKDKRGNGTAGATVTATFAEEGGARPGSTSTPTSRSPASRRSSAAASSRTSPTSCSSSSSPACRTRSATEPTEAAAHDRWSAPQPAPAAAAAATPAAAADRRPPTPSPRRRHPGVVAGTAVRGVCRLRTTTPWTWARRCCRSWRGPTARRSAIALVALVIGYLLGRRRG